MHPATTARRNVVPSAAELHVVTPEERAAIEVPDLPADRLWDPRTSEFWQAAWQSPMRLEWDPGDQHKLLMMAYALDEFYVVAGTDELKRLDKAYALAKLGKLVVDTGARMGLDPFARRSLQWTLVKIEKDEAERDLAKEQTKASRSSRPKRSTAAGKKRGLTALG